MKLSQSKLPRTEPIRLLAHWAYSTPAIISEPPKTLLVVDDDSMLRKLEAEILSLEGYNVLEAESAAEALRLAGVTATIHLLITDLEMPEVDGLELTRRFREVHPKTPVLMVSGSLPFLRLRSEVDINHFGFLAKPFLFDELLLKVRTLLNATTPLRTRKTRCRDCLRE